MSAFSANIGTDQYSPINSELRKNAAKKSVDSCSVSLINMVSCSKTCDIKSKTKFYAKVEVSDLDIPSFKKHQC